MALRKWFKFQWFEATVERGEKWEGETGEKDEEETGAKLAEGREIEPGGRVWAEMNQQ